MDKHQTTRKRTNRITVTVAGIQGEEAYVLEASLRGERVVIERWGMAAVGGTAGKPGGVPEDGRGQAIARALAEAGIRIKSVVVCLPARSVVIKRVQLPPAAPDQIPQLVRFEAQRHLPLPLDQLATGYLPVDAAHRGPGGTGGEGTDVLLAITRRDDLLRLSAALEGAGLHVEGCGIDALALADDYVRASPEIATAENGHASLVVSSDGQGLHAQIMHGARLLSTRYLPSGERDWGLDLARSLTAYALDRPAAPVGEAIVLGDVDESLLARATGLPVRFLSRAAEGDPLPEFPEPYRPLAALARQWLAPSRFGAVLAPGDWQTGTRPTGRSGALLAVAASIVGLGLLVAVQLDRQERARKDADSASRLIRLVRSDRKQLARLKAERDLLSERYRLIGAGAPGSGTADPGQSSPLELLRRIGSRTPSGVWLTQVVYRRGEPLQILGTTRHGAEVTAFIRGLESMPGCERVELGYLRSATVQDAEVTQFRVDCVPDRKPQETTMARENTGRTPR